MSKGGHTYIITNEHNTVLYTGSTSELKIRIWQHRSKAFPTSFLPNTIAISWFGSKTSPQ